MGAGGAGDRSGSGRTGQGSHCGPRAGDAPQLCGSWASWGVVGLVRQVGKVSVGKHLMVGCFLMGQTWIFLVLPPSIFEDCLKPAGAVIFPLGCGWQWDAASEDAARDVSAQHGKWDLGSRACPCR